MKNLLFLIALFLVGSFLITIYSFWALGYFFAPEHYDFIPRCLFTMGYFLTSKWMLKSYIYLILFIVITPITISLSFSLYQKLQLRNARMVDQEIINLKKNLTTKIEEKENEIQKTILKKRDMDYYIENEVNRLYKDKQLEFSLCEYEIEQKRNQLIQKEEHINTKMQKINAYLEEIKGLQNQISIKDKKIAEFRGTAKKSIQLIKEGNLGFCLRILKKI
ncbi:hypothetical protein ACTVJH_13720 [Desulfoplanes sp. PS50]